MQKMTEAALVYRVTYDQNKKLKLQKNKNKKKLKQKNPTRNAFCGTWYLPHSHKLSQ